MAELLWLDDPGIEIALRRSARARRFTLSVPQNGDAPRVTVPPSAALTDVRMFLMRQSDWLRAALERTPPVVAVKDGSGLPVGGTMLHVVQITGRRRPPFIKDDQLVLSGPGAPGPRIAAWLKERARSALAPIARHCAAELDRDIGRITLRDTKGRWGSCTSKGDLSFSWRLAMAPPEVLDYVAAHEAAHLVEMNHGPQFWALVDQLRPNWKTQRDWLKREGAALHRYRFDSP
ncbi:MAG: SprT family zinc-dependent metalloprotease [Pseudomonadota bacterium]